VAGSIGQQGWPRHIDSNVATHKPLRARVRAAAVVLCTLRGLSLQAHGSPASVRLWRDPSERPTPVLAPELHPPLAVSYVSPGPASRDAPSPTLSLPRDVSSPTLSPPPAVWRREDSPDTLARLPGSESKAAASAQPSSRRRGCGHLRPRLVGSDRIRPVSTQMQPTLPPQPSAVLRALPVARCQSPSPRTDP